MRVAYKVVLRKGTRAKACVFAWRPREDRLRAAVAADEEYVLQEKKPRYGGHDKLRRWKIVKQTVSPVLRGVRVNRVSVRTAYAEVFPVATTVRPHRRVLGATFRGDAGALAHHVAVGVSQLYRRYPNILKVPSGCLRLR